MEAIMRNDSFLHLNSNPATAIITTQVPPAEYNTSLTILGIVKAVMLIIVMCVIAVGHGLVFISYMRNKTMRTPMNFYILQLSIADIIVGIVFIPMDIISTLQVKWFENLPLCLFYQGTAFLSLAGSVIALNALFLDRLLSIVRPFTYINEMSCRRYVSSVLGIWFIPVTACFVLPMTWHNGAVVIPESIPCVVVYTMKRTYFKAILLPLAYSLAFTVVGFNVPIFYIAHKQSQALKNQAVAIHGSSGLNHFEDGKTRLKSERKIAKTAFLVFGVLYASYLPFIIALSHKVIDYESYVNPFSTDYELARIFSMLLLINSALNPIIYAVKLKQYRPEFMQILKPLMSCKVSVRPLPNGTTLSN